MGATIEITNETLSHLIEILHNHLTQRKECSHLHNISLTDNHSSTIHGTKKYVLNHDSQQVQAVMYIVVVLMFYSVSLAALLIKYMRHEKRTSEEEQHYQDFLTKTKQLALQQAKRDFARRVSLQLVHMANFGQMRYPDKLGRMSTLIEVSELEGVQTKLVNDLKPENFDVHCTPPKVGSLETETTPFLHDDETTEDSIPEMSGHSGKTAISKISPV